MRKNPPVFGKDRDLGLWRQIHSPTGSTNKAIDTILSSDESVHSAVLSGTIEYLKDTWDKADARAKKKAEKNGEETFRTQKDVMRDIILRSRTKDCMAGVNAAKALLSKSDIDGAYEMMSIASRPGEVLHTSLTLAEIRMFEGDIIGAKEAAIRAYSIDPSIDRIYDILQDVDAIGEWSAKGAIEDIHHGRMPRKPVTSGELEELYVIYDLWYKGDRDDATQRLVNSEKYLNGNVDYLIAAARMSAGEHDWQSAMKIYDSVLDENTPEFLRYEIAETMIYGGDSAGALGILRGCDMNNIRVLRDIVKAHTSDGRGLDDAIDRFLDSEFADWDEISEVTHILIKSNRIQEADRVLETYVLEQPGNAHALAMLSSVRLKQDKVKNAMVLAKKAIRDRKCIPAKIQMGRMLFVTDNIPAAEKKCNTALSNDPYDVDALSLKRDILIHKKSYREALDVCNKILRIEPGNTDTLISMSEALSALGESEGSAELFNKALHADLNWGNTRKVLESLIYHGMNTNAIYVCQNIEQDFPDEPLVYRFRGNAEYSKKMYAEAVESYTKALKLDVNDPLIWHSKGMAEEALRDYDAAEDSYNRAVILDLSEPEFWISKASIQEMRGDNHGAVESLNRAIELDPGAVYALVRKAMLFSESGRVREAAYYMEMALSTAPDDRDLLRETVRMHLKSDMAIRGLPIAKHLYDLSQTPDAIDLYARCLVITDDSKTAMEVLSSGLNSDPDNIVLLRCKYECMFFMKRYDDAESTLNKISALDPRYPDLGHMRSKLDMATASSTTDMKGEYDLTESDEEILRDMMDGMEVPETYNEPGIADDRTVSHEHESTDDITGTVDGITETGSKDSHDDPEDHSTDMPETTSTYEEGEDSTLPGGEEDDDIHSDKEGDDRPESDDGVAEGNTYTLSKEEPSHTDTVEEEVHSTDGPTQLVIEMTDEKPIIFGEDETIEVGKMEPIEMGNNPAEDPARPSGMSLAYRDATAMLESGNAGSAISLLEVIVDAEPDDARGHSLLGRAYCITGDLSKAVSELDMAISLGTDDSQVYSTRAAIHESMGEADDAIACYKAALDHDDDSIDTMRSLAYLLNSEESYDDALKVMSKVVDNHEAKVSDIVLYADLARFCGDDAAVTRSVDKFLMHDAHVDETVAFIRILDEAGHHDDAARLLNDGEEPLQMSPSLKKTAEKVLRYACTTGMSAYDPDTYDNCGVDVEESKVMIDYISNAPEYGVIGESDPAFEEMELRSMDMILKCNLTDLEKNDVSLELIFTKGGCRNIDEALRIHSYIKKVLDSDVDSDDPELIQMAMEIPDDARLYDIVKQSAVGIFCAKAIKTMSVR